MVEETGRMASDKNLLSGCADIWEEMVPPWDVQDMGRPRGVYEREEDMKDGIERAVELNTESIKLLSEGMSHINELIQSFMAPDAYKSIVEDNRKSKDKISNLQMQNDILEETNKKLRKKLDSAECLQGGRTRRIIKKV